MRKLPPSIIFGFTKPGTLTGDDSVESLTETVREALLPGGTVGAVDVGYPRVRGVVSIQPRMAPASTGTEPKSKLELARQQWREGLLGRVRAVEALLSTSGSGDMPTPHIDGDD